MKKYLKSLIGFPIGNLMLALSYILIYVVDGQATYAQEITKLVEFRYMLGQVISSGIVFSVVLYTITYISEVFENKDNNKAKSLVRFLISLVVILGVAKCISAVLQRKGTLKGYSGTVFFTTSVIIMIAFSIGYIVNQEIQNAKINKALRQRQGK